MRNSKTLQQHRPATSVGTVKARNFASVPTAHVLTGFEGWDLLTLQGRRTPVPLLASPMRSVQFGAWLQLSPAVLSTQQQPRSHQCGIQPVRQPHAASSTQLAAPAPAAPPHACCCHCIPSLSQHTFAPPCAAQLPLPPLGRSPSVACAPCVCSPHAADGKAQPPCMHAI